MAMKTINLGSSPNKGDGDPLRVAFEKINANFEELFENRDTVAGTFTGDIIGSVYSSDSTLLVDSEVGRFNGDLIGSVFADDSTIVIDGTSGIIPGYVSKQDLKDIAAASVDFNEFKTKLANL